MSATLRATIQADPDREAVMSRTPAETRLPRSGNAALAAGALIQAALGAVFVLAGLGKVVAPNYTEQFRDFVQGSVGASSGPLALLVQTLVVPHIDVVAHLARITELTAGAVLVLSAVEVARRRVAGPVKLEAQGGRTARGTFTIETPGTYPFVCTVPGHAAAGMTGTLTAR